MTTETGFIVRAMEALAAKYQIEHGRAPLGFVMGLKDYRVMRQEMSHMGLYLDLQQGVRQLYGLPIYLKISSGIELLVHEEFAERVLEAHTVAERLAMVQGAIIR